MKKNLLILAAVSILAGVLAGCGATPEPTEPPPTQTPWIVVVTATPRPEEAARVQPTQTPWIIIATLTPALTKPATTVPEKSPTATAEPTQTEVAPTPTLEPPTATDTPVASELKYPPPTLLEPPNDRPVSWRSTVLLQWSSVGELAEDEYYHLHLERRPMNVGQDWYGDYVYTRETEFLADQSFLAPFHQSADRGDAMVYWWVRVVRKTGEDENGKPTGVDIGRFSEERTLLLAPKP